jgi:hypothetical protein
MYLYNYIRNLCDDKPNRNISDKLFDKLGWDEEHFKAGHYKAVRDCDLPCRIKNQCGLAIKDAWFYSTTKQQFHKKLVENQYRYNLKAKDMDEMLGKITSDFFVDISMTDFEP